MTLNDAIRKYVRETFNLAADANDDTIKACIASKMVAGELTVEKLAELTRPAVDAVGVLDSRIDAKLAPLMSAMTGMADAMKTLAARPAAPAPVASPAPGVDQGKAAMEEAAKSVSGNGGVAVVPVQDRFERTKKSAICPEFIKGGSHQHPHPQGGRQARLDDIALDHPSDLDKAICGMYVKLCLGARTPGGLEKMGDLRRRWMKWTDLDEDLFKYASNEVKWGGCLNGPGVDVAGRKVYREKLSDLDRKDLLDDATSGGLEIAPIVFDDAVMLTPVLNGELFPLVQVVNITRGRRIEGASIGNPTFGAQTEGTALTPFDTTSFIAAIDTNIYNAAGAMELGLDFEEDSPVAIGQIVIQQYGEKALEWLDNQIANGDGTTEPQGVFNASGTTTVNSVLGSGGPAVVGDYENLMFGLAKTFRTQQDISAGRIVYLGNDTTYRRSRSVPVGPSDVRRVFGMDHNSYRIMDTPFKVQNDIANTKAAYVNFRYYRMYRRLGMSLRVETAGRTLALKNERLIVARMRFGGRLMLGGAAAICTDMQS